MSSSSTSPDAGSHPETDSRDRGSFAPDDPEKLGTSNTGYGPNIPGTVCDPDGTIRQSTDRWPRDGVTVTTDAYRWHASGRWMVRSLQIAKPGQPGVYEPDLIDRWKGRAFQQSPDSSISLVGFEDEQVNWKANSALLGERYGPVRAIREIWGADSGTNVTKTETFYRNAITYHYHLRVHPIPPDGLYTSWDYNAGVVSKYFNVMKPDGVTIDGVNDDIGNVDNVLGTPAYFDVPDPTFDAPADLYHWEEVSGANDNGSLVYELEIKGPTSAENPTVVPYYRDDKCFDDGTGDHPVPRPWPGEASTDPRVEAGYSAENGGIPYSQLTCDQKQGAWGENGVHFFFTNDTDNAFGPKPVTEVDAQQWQFAVPTAQPTNVGDAYANDVRAPLQVAAADQASTPAHATTLTYTGQAAGTVGDPATLSVQLSDDAGKPVAGETVSFAFQGNAYRASTDQSGTASVEVTPQPAAGQDQVAAAFGGDGPYLPSATQGTLTASTRAVRITLAIPPRRSWKGSSGTMTATLSDVKTGAPIGGETVQFAVSGQAWASSQTDQHGVAPAPTSDAWTTGTPVAASFGGDGTYDPVSVQVAYSPKGSTATATSRGG